jgi:hypothetical protein
MDKKTAGDDCCSLQTWTVSETMTKALQRPFQCSFRIIPKTETLACEGCHNFNCAHWQLAHCTLAVGTKGDEIKWRMLLQFTVQGHTGVP